MNLGVLQNSTRVPRAISAIVPTYNRARYLPDALNSLLNQTLRPYELIVVDDGSIDATDEVLRGFRDRIRVIRKPNGGKASALNLGLKQARGEFIWIFDDDDVALPDCLEKLFGNLIEHPECGYSYGGYDHLIEMSDGTTRIFKPDLRIDKRADFRLSLLERCYLFQPGMLVRHAVFDAVGLFNEVLVRSQDYEMLLRIARQFKGVEVDSTVFHQRQHSGLRGSASAPVATGQVEASWIRYDALIFSQIYKTYALSEYLPGRPGRELSPAERRCALLERSCIMARKGLWKQAAADLRVYTALLQTSSPSAITEQERAVLRRFFGPYSYADSKLAESGALFDVLREVSQRRLRWEIAAELLAPIAGELGYGVRRGYVRYFLGTLRKCIVFVSKYLSARRRPDEAVGEMSGMESR